MIAARRAPFPLLFPKLKAISGLELLRLRTTSGLEEPVPFALLALLTSIVSSGLEPLPFPRVKFTTTSGGDSPEVPFAPKLITISGVDAAAVSPVADGVGVGGEVVDDVGGGDRLPDGPVAAVLLSRA